MTRSVFVPLVLLTTGLSAAEIPPSGAPDFRQPQLAAAYGQVALVYGSGSTIWFASSPDSGRTFAPGVKVADTGAVALGRHRGPRITILRDAMLITAVAGQTPAQGEHAHGLPEQGDLTVWRSTDHGKTWLRASIVNDIPGASREGLHSIAADSRGNLFAAWLDLREKGTQLYGARSTDGGKTWSKNVHIYASPDGTICQCCDPSVAIDEHGEIAVMFRNAITGSRDLYLTRSTDGLHFSQPEKLGNGTWKIAACPMDGGGMALEHGKIVTAWRRDTELFLDRPGTPETRIAEGKDVAIAAGAKGTYLVWSDAQGIEALAPAARVPLKIAGAGGFPTVVALADGSALAAWEDNGNIRTVRLP